MNISFQVHEDFERARRKAFWRHLATRLLRRDNSLLSFEEARRRLCAQAQHYGGLRQVAIDQIVGSVSRYHDFDRAFLPRRTTTKGRWLSIDRAYYEETLLPPIELYQLGETYFVKDGNHRVSVAREQGQAFIDAYVVELSVPVPIGSLAELEDWVRRQDALDFMSRTRLASLRPAAHIELTLLGQYDKLLEHIAVHRWFLGVEQRRPLSWEEAVTSWHDHVYAPLAEVIQSSGVLRDFPGRTQADLYLWIIEHRWYLHQAGVLDERTPVEETVRQYAAEFSRRPGRRLARLGRRAAVRFPAA
jgi:hypothetical protein